MFKSIGIFPKYYAIINLDGSRLIVRRDVYWDSGFKCPKEIKLISQIEAQLDYGWQP